VTAEGFEYGGACARCKGHITAHLRFESDGAAVAPPPVIGSYHECGGRDAPGGLSAQAVPLTLRGAPE
jgi:hypothetical protein